MPAECPQETSSQTSVHIAEWHTPALCYQARNVKPNEKPFSIFRVTLSFELRAADFGFLLTKRTDAWYLLTAL